MEQPSEILQIEALRNGNEAVFDAVFRQLYEPLCRYALQFTDGAQAEAEDIVQQAFVRLWEKRATLDINHSLKAYLYRSIHNAGLNRQRHLTIRKKHQQHATVESENTHGYNDEGRRDLLERLQRALEALPPQCRQVFELSRFETLKYREIAEQLGISIKTVETQMGKALRVLRLELADFLATAIIAITWLLG